MSGPEQRVRYSDSLRTGRYGYRIPVGGRDFPHPSRPALGPTQNPINGYRVFPVGKAAGVWRWPRTSSRGEAKETVELYSPSGLSWPVIEWNSIYISVLCEFTQHLHSLHRISQANFTSPASYSEVHGFKFRAEIDCRDMSSLRDYPQSFYAHDEIIGLPQIGSRPLPCTTFPVHYLARSQNCEKRLWASSCLSVCLSVRPSVRPHGTTRLPLAEFSWNLMFECF